MQMHEQEQFQDFHWMIEMLQTIDVGVVILDKNYVVKSWNGFMENHSGVDGKDALEQSIFTIFKEMDEFWLRHKADTVFKLKNQAFTIWEQNPYIFKFKNNRPITGVADFMYQNCTFIPIKDTRGEVDKLAVLVYDVTDTAVNKLDALRSSAKLKTLSRTDVLTQLYNRGYWEEALKHEFNRYIRTQNISTLVMFDIDHFKNVNDTHGHQAGDAALKEVSRVLKENLRETDIAGRYGGEEFTIILVDTDAEHAMVFCERLRKAIESCVIQYLDIEVQVTVSLGVYEIHPKLVTHQQWIEGADTALYKCKNDGRNQTQIYSYKDH
ncbi:sensor domain-containing diguanylate cyclase [Marinicellulosiphila megalodicopiae]|uniref:sensor domain-containing diguanylate cyclase n=1 Tax=Marinicellulosiphila megalodicopiae TaxID=2724896 RepID=UPI003BAEF7DD